MSIAAAILFFLISLSGVVATNIYLSGWIIRMYDLKKKWPVRTAVAVISLAGILSIPLSVSDNGFTALFTGAAIIIVMYMVYLLLFALAAGLISRVRKIPKRYVRITVPVLALLVTVYGLFQAQRFWIAERTYIMRGLDKPVRILHLSDIHLGIFRGRGWLAKIVEHGTSVRPDMVVITGDIMDSRVRLKDRPFDILKKFKVPVYFVFGNHDAMVGKEAIAKQLEAAGVQVLRNRVVRTQGIQLIGLEHMRPDRNSFDMHTNGTGTIKSILSKMKIDGKTPSVLLQHGPGGVRYMSEKGIGLMLAGHTHGGQLFPFTMVASLIFPYNQGEHRYKNTRIHISRGVGTFGPPMRVGTDQEITLIRLVPDTKMGMYTPKYR